MTNDKQESLVNRLSSLVVLPHSVFALPFALSAFLLAAKKNELSFTADLWIDLLLVVLTVISARMAAMGFNRIVDREIDRRNPRTKEREIPRGALSVRQSAIFVGGSVAFFFLFTALLGTHCLVLSPIVLLVLFGYSVTKRFTRYAHLVLGLALALAPGGAWWVLRPAVELLPLLLMGGVLLWVAGFDILYSCQDYEFDKKEGLFSIPAAVGVPGALNVAKLFHAVSFLLFVGVGEVAGLGLLYRAGMFFFGALLAYQHTLVSPTDLSRIDRAFFTTNGVISLGYLFLILAVVSL